MSIVREASVRPYTPPRRASNGTILAVMAGIGLALSVPSGYCPRCHHRSLMDDARAELDEARSELEGLMEEMKDLRERIAAAKEAAREARARLAELKAAK